MKAIINAVLVMHDYYIPDGIIFFAMERLRHSALKRIFRYRPIVM